MRKYPRTIRAFLLSSAVGLCASALGEPVRVYMIGNSLTDEVKYDDWAALCAEAGQPVVYARKMIPGAPLGWHKDHPADGFLTKPYGAPEDAFKNHPWDALTLQPFRIGESEAALYYANLLWEGSPEARVYVYAQWPGRGKIPDWPQAFAGIAKPNYLDVLDALRQSPRGKQAFLIPAGWVFERLHRKASLGLVSGIRSAWDLYSDGVHVNNVGSYIVGLTFYASILGRSPVGLPIGGYQGRMGSTADHVMISPELAAVLQETVWETVTAMPETGVRSDLPPALCLPALPAAVAGEPFSATLDAAFGQPPYTFALARGTLPDGLVLSSEGVVSGTSAATGAVDIAVAVTDAAAKSASREYRLVVGADQSPTLLTERLPVLRQGQHLDLALAARGGNGDCTWSLETGALPLGLTLDPVGRLHGSPAQSGDYAFTLAVRDGDGRQPESDSRAFAGSVEPADPAKVLLVRQAVEPIEVDGVFAPSEGWDLRQSATKPFQGDSDNTVRFDLQWAKNRLYVAVEVEDAAIIDGRGTAETPPPDAVVFYFDGLNNREATYNADDRRLAFNPKGQADRAFNLGQSFFTKVQARPTERGYRLECSLIFSDIGLPWMPDPPPGQKSLYAGQVFGFDLVNCDTDRADGTRSQLGWRGTVANSVDPSGFGTCILLPRGPQGANTGTTR